MSCILCLLQTEVKSVVTSFTLLKEEVIDINKAYWASDAQTTIAAKGDSDVVTLATKLIKTEYVSGVTYSEELEDFFINDAVISPADYAATCHQLKYGNATGVKLTEATEDIGDRLKQVALDSLELYEKAHNILEMYSNNEIDDILANLDAQRVITCTGMTKDDLSSGITLIEQFKKMLNNESVTQGDYAATLAKWKRL